MSGRCYFPGEERLEPPPEYVEHLNSIGGLNRFGEPNFILVWGQTRTWRIYGQKEGGGKGQHTVLQFGGIPAWHIMAWKPPEAFGTPALWYALSWDPETRTHGLGDYPWRGDYVPCKFNLYVKRIEGGGLSYGPGGQVVDRPGRLIIDAMPLNHYILDLVIPNVIKELDITESQRIIAGRKRREAEQRQASQQAYDAYCDAAPAFGGVAGTYESNRNAQEDRIRRGKSAEEMKRRLGTGHQQIR